MKIELDIKKAAVLSHDKRFKQLSFINLKNFLIIYGFKLSSFILISSYTLTIGKFIGFSKTVLPISYIV